MKKSLFIRLLAIMFILCMSGSLFAETGGPGDCTVMGQIGIKDVGPMMEGTIFFYDAASGPPPAPASYWRVPTHTFPVDANSRFIAKIPEGTYYIGTIERKSGESLGPPQEGDYFFIGRDKNGKPRELTLWPNSVVDLQLVSAAEKAMTAGKGTTAIQGVIRDKYGEPVEGMLVFAYTTQEMFDNPLFVSERTGKDGKYLLRVVGGGKYFLKARADYKTGRPATNEFVGVYRDGEPITVKKGTIRGGAHIKVFRIRMGEG